jgi:hypothetical protein
MHYTFEKLSDYLRGVLSEAESEAVVKHIQEGCDMCADRLSILRKLRLVSETSEFVSPPEELSESVKRIYSAPSSRRSVSRKVRELSASLVYDSYLKPTRAAFRSIGTRERQVLFTAGGYDIDYRITRAEDGKQFILTGQLLCHSAEGSDVSRFAVCLKPSRGKMLRSSVNEFGEFEFKNVQSARYVVYVESDSLRINLGKIDLT